ncbi:MAG: hypothetical protein LBK73_06630 [Treponema sp.]|nr:hypothetical protein [Treponema sp.]
MRYENFANPVDWLNCRDEYAYGGYHGITTVYDEALDNGDRMRRMPLGL